MSTSASFIITWICPALVRWARDGILRKTIDDYLGNFDFRGKRVLDVGTATGFLSFEMEKRGAEVVSFDMASRAQWQLVPFSDQVHPFRY